MTRPSDGLQTLKSEFFRSLAHPLMADLLRVARQMLNRRLAGTETLLRELRDEPAR